MQSCGVTLSSTASSPPSSSSLPVDIGRGEPRPSRDCTEITVPPLAPAKLRRDLSIACADHAAVACTARRTPRPQSPGARHGVEGPPAKGGVQEGGDAERDSPRLDLTDEWGGRVPLLASESRLNLI